MIDALREQDWSGCSVSLRINGLDTHYCYRDLVDVEQAGRHLDSDHDPQGELRRRRPPGGDASEPEAGARELHLGDQWHYALARIAVVCRAYGLRPIDGPFGDFTDPEGYLASARRAAVLGYEGKWAIHPSQIELANQVFTPSEPAAPGSLPVLARVGDERLH